MMGRNGLVIIKHAGIDPLIELREELEGIEDKRFTVRQPPCLRCANRPVYGA